ncbi:MAG: HIT family protein [Campylobacterales bacterium]
MIYKGRHLRIEWHESAVPWLKIFTLHPYKELSECPPPVRADLFEALDLCERALLEYYRPDKINIASFGNYLPQLHFHVTARFKNDSHFPEPMWGVKQREGDLRLPDHGAFERILKQRLSASTL